MKKHFWLLGLLILAVALSTFAACGDDDDDDASDIDCEGACMKALDCVEEEYSSLGVLRGIAEQECLTECEEDGTQEIIDCVMETECEDLIEDMCGLPIEDYLG